MVKRAKVDDENEIETFLSDYGIALQIDPNGLDQAWLEQPGLFLDIANRLALEISLRDEGKDDLKDLEAELDAIVRENHADDDKKPTETAIKNEIAQDSSIKAAKRALRERERSVQRLSALKESYQQRRYALQDLTSLHLGGYYQSNSGHAREARAATHESSRKAMQSERKRREKE